MNFFQFLYDGCKGKVNIRALPGGNEFYALEYFLPGMCIQNHQGKNLYFGVATRDGKGGGKANIIHIPALWIDIDEKETSRDLIKQKFEEFPLKSSLTVKTGGGWHVYWKLKAPLEQKDIGRCESYLKRLAIHFESDQNACDASRILRVPGSKNHKYKPPRDVELVQKREDATYSLGDFDFLPDVKKTESSKQDSSSDQKFVGDLQGVQSGQRNSTCASLAGRYLAKKLSLEEVKEILLAWNLRNSPPLETSEVIQIIESVAKTDSRNHPLDLPHISEVLKKVESDIKAGRKQQIGFDPCFDFLRKTIRAIIPTHLWIVGGYTSIGKTMFVIDLVMRLIKQNPAIALFTVEMSASQYALRMISNQTGIPSLRLMFDEVSDEQNAAIYEALHILNRSKIYLFDELYEFKEIQKACENLKSKLGLDIVVIDFIQNLLGRGTIYDRMSRLSPQLLELAKELNCTVIALSQVSNEAVKESLEIIGFKGAGEIAAAADLAIWLERKKRDDRMDRDIVAWIRKNRHGPIGNRTLRYAENFTRFEEIQDAESNYFQKKYSRNRTSDGD